MFLQPAIQLPVTHPSKASQLLCHGTLLYNKWVTGVPRYESLQPSSQAETPDQSHSFIPLIQHVIQILSHFLCVLWHGKFGKHWKISSCICVADTYTGTHVYIGAMFGITKNWNISNVHQSISHLISGGMLIWCIIQQWKLSNIHIDMDKSRTIMLKKKKK